MVAPFPKPPGSIRGFNPATDTDVVVDLIADSFTLHNDSEGMNVLRQMRDNARHAREDLWYSPSPGSHPGYVWLIDGQIVGNITIISFLDRLRHIALIANVAVKPEFRGLGIASALTQQALRFAKAKRAWQVWLQVSNENHAAQKMYQRLGFDLVRKVSTWQSKMDELICLNTSTSREAIRYSPESFGNGANTNSGCANAIRRTHVGTRP